MAVTAPGDNAGQGALWIFTRSAGVWTQQGLKLVGTGSVGTPLQGTAVAIDSIGDTVALGGTGDNAGAGAVWVFVRSAGVWTQQGSKLVGTGVLGGVAAQGSSVSLTSSGNTLVLGGPSDDTPNIGAGWVFQRTAGTWTQQQKLTPTGNVGDSNVGFSASISADGNTVVLGGPRDNARVGAAWIFTQLNQVWTQLGNKLVSTTGTSADRGTSVCLTKNGLTLAIGGGALDQPLESTVSLWQLTPANAWNQIGILSSPTVAATTTFGISCSFSSEGTALAIGEVTDTSNAGAAWIFI